MFFSNECWPQLLAPLPSQHVYVGPIWFLVGLHGYQVGMVPIWASYMGPAWLSYIGPTWANKSGLPI